MTYATPTPAQKAGTNALFAKSLTKAQAKAARDWVDESEMTGPELLAQQRRLRAESKIAQQMLGEQAA